MQLLRLESRENNRYDIFGVAYLLVLNVKKNLCTNNNKMGYSTAEKFDIIRLYYSNNRKPSTTRNEYHRIFPNRFLPSKSTIKGELTRVGKHDRHSRFRGARVMSTAES